MADRLPTIIKLKKVCKKPHRVTFYEGEKHCTKHFATYSFHVFGLETTNTGDIDEPKTFFAHDKGTTVKAAAQAYGKI